MSEEETEWQKRDWVLLALAVLLAVRFIWR